MTQFTTINLQGDIQTWSLADYDYDRDNFINDYKEYEALGMIYEEDTFDKYYDDIAEARALIMTRLDIDYTNEEAEMIIEEELTSLLENI